ncbi:hypothetical protein L0222_30475, partial [bacterium]|nr:hypothetical protein [bacterium]
LTICSINAQKQFLGVEPLRFSLRFADRRSFRTVSSFQLAELELKKAAKMPALQNPDKLLPIFSQLLWAAARRLAGFVARSLPYHSGYAPRSRLAIKPASQQHMSSYLWEGTLSLLSLAGLAKDVPDID